MTNGSDSGAGRRVELRSLVVVASAVATLVAAAAIIVPLALSLNDRSSAADTLEVRGGSSENAPEANPYVNALNLNEGYEEINDERQTYWRLPVSVSLASFPTEVEPYAVQCTEAQLAWLEENATEVDSRENLVTLRNAATTGGSLSIENIRYAGVEVAGEPWVMLRCPRGGIGGAGPQPVMLSVDGSASTWGTAYPESDNLWPPGSPATINIAPGEVYTNVFIETDLVHYDQRGPVVGDMSGGSETVVLIEDLRVDRPGVRGYTLGWDFGVDDFTCWSPDPAGGEDQWGRPLQISRSCTLAEGEELLRSAAANAEGR